MAGCSGDGGGDDGGDDGPTDTDPPDDNASPGQTPTATVTPTKMEEVRERREVGKAVEPQLQIRPFDKKPQDWDHGPYQATVGAQSRALRHTLSEYGANHANPTEDYIPLLMAESKLVDGEVWRVKLSEKDFTWHDGSEVTMKDRFNKVKYDELRRAGFGEETTFEEVRLVDDRTMEHVLKEPQHPVAYLGKRTPVVLFQASVFEPHLEAMKDASSKREAFLAHSDFEDVTTPPEEWVGHGQFKISDLGENRVIYERYDDYPEPYKSYQNIETIKLPIRTGNTAPAELMKKGETDWFNAGLPDGVEESQLPDLYETEKKRTTKQYEYRFNHNNKHLERRGVRRAIAYLMRYKDYTQNTINKYFDPIQDGTTAHIGNSWTDDYNERVQNYIDYGDGVSEMAEEAAREMKSAGYERNDGGKWVGPDGDTVSLLINHASWFTDESVTLADWLTKFGIEATAEEPSIFWESYHNPDGDWDLINNFQSRGPNHPSSSYGNKLQYGLKMTRVNEDGEREPWGNRDLEYELPTEVGALDLSGETETINVPELQAVLEDPASTREDMAEPFRKLSWFWNFHVPDVVAVGGIFMYVGDHANYEWLDWNGDRKGDAVNRYEFSFSLNAGYLRGKEA